MPGISNDHLWVFKVSISVFFVFEGCIKRDALHVNHDA